jgi:hypothetical protein
MAAALFACSCSAFARAAWALSTACWRRSPAFRLAASSLARSRSPRFCSFLKARAAFRSAALSTRREAGCLGLRPFDLWVAFAGLSLSPRSVRSSASSPKGPSDPTGRLRTTPGFAMVAAMTSGSSLSLAAPWWKRLLSAPRLPMPPSSMVQRAPDRRSPAKSGRSSVFSPRDAPQLTPSNATVRSVVPIYLASRESARRANSAAGPVYISTHAACRSELSVNPPQSTPIVGIRAFPAASAS